MPAIVLADFDALTEGTRVEVYDSERGELIQCGRVFDVEVRPEDGTVFVTVATPEPRFHRTYVKGSATFYTIAGGV